VEDVEGVYLYRILLADSYEFRPVFHPLNTTSWTAIKEGDSDSVRVEVWRIQTELKGQLKKEGQSILNIDEEALLKRDAVLLLVDGSPIDSNPSRKLHLIYEIRDVRQRTKER
jgi:hypothetical protein